MSDGPPPYYGQIGYAHGPGQVHVAIIGTPLLLTVDPSTAREIAETLIHMADLATDCLVGEHEGHRKEEL